MGKTLVKKGHSELVTDEVEAIEGYDHAINDESNPENKKTLEHIRDEELEHIDELEGMDKMTSDEAWNDFKSNYDPKEFDQAHKAVFDDNPPESETATVDGKLDTIASMVNEVKTDTKILANVAPKLQAQTELEEDQLETDTDGEEETFGGDIDIFGGDTAEGGEEEMADEGKRTPGEEEVVDGEQPAEDETEKEGEEIALSDGEEEGEQQAEERSEEEQPAEEGKEEPADDEQSEDDELTEKMVNTIVRQSTDIKALKSQIQDLTAKIERMEKSITKSTVQRPARVVRQKSPMITKRIGVVSKPPVSSGYTGTYNRRDGETTAKADWSNPRSIVDGYKKSLQEE